MQRALVAAALLTLTVLAGCAEDKPATTTPETGLPAGTSNLGGNSTKVVTSVFPGNYDFTSTRSNVLLKGNLSIKPAERVMIPSPQGGSIEMGLNLPDTAEKVPILMFSTPYMDAAGAISGTTTHVNPSASVKSLIENFVPHGYAVVTHSVRGTGGSDGCNDLMGATEVADIDAALTWLGTQSWSSGAIAMTGVSYDGSTPWSAAATGNPYLKTIIPISGVPDLYGLMYRNGSSESRGPVLLNALYIQGGIDSGSPMSISNRMCPEAVEGLVMSGAAGILGTDPSGYWQARNRKPAVEANYKGSVLSVQGLQDWNVDPSQVIPWVDHLESLGLETKQMLGQWGHAWPDGIGTNGSNTPATRADWKEILLRWMDKELKGMEDVDVGPPVQVRDNLGRWRNEAHYPPHDANWTVFHPTGTLLATEAGPAESAVLYPNAGAGEMPSTPAVAETSVKGAADFALGPAATDLLIAGLPQVPIRVVPDGAGGYIGAAIIARNTTSNTEDVLGWTTMNLNYADGTTTFKPVTPGMPVMAMMEIQPMDGVVQKGEQLVLRLWMFSDNGRVPTAGSSLVTVELGGNSGSTVIIPFIERGPEVYFTPPIGPEGDK